MTALPAGKFIFGIWVKTASVKPQCFDCRRVFEAGDIGYHGTDSHGHPVRFCSTCTKNRREAEQAGKLVKA